VNTDSFLFFSWMVGLLLLTNRHVFHGGRIGYQILCGNAWVIYILANVMEKSLGGSEGA
jgi:hypothetical protein